MLPWNFQYKVHKTCKHWQTLAWWSDLKGTFWGTTKPNRYKNNTPLSTTKKGFVSTPNFPPLNHVFFEIFGCSFSPWPIFLYGKKTHNQVPHAHTSYLGGFFAFRFVSFRLQGLGTLLLQLVGQEHHSPSHPSMTKPRWKKKHEISSEMGSQMLHGMGIFFPVWRKPFFIGKYSLHGAVGDIFNNHKLKLKGVINYQAQVINLSWWSE